MRQNSQFIIIKLALDKKVAVNVIIKNNYKVLQEYFLILEDQKELDNIYIFLKPSKRVIKVCKGNKVILDQILYLINFLISYFKGTKVHISTIFYYLQVACLLYTRKFIRRKDSLRSYLFTRKLLSICQINISFYIIKYLPILVYYSSILLTVLTISKAIRRSDR